MKAHEHLKFAMEMVETALDLDTKREPGSTSYEELLHMNDNEREQIERDLNLIEAKRALIALLEDAQSDGWSQLEVNRLKAALTTSSLRPASA